MDISFLQLPSHIYPPGDLLALQPCQPGEGLVVAPHGGGEPGAALLGEGLQLPAVAVRSSSLVTPVLGCAGAGSGQVVQQAHRARGGDLVEVPG